MSEEIAVLAIHGMGNTSPDFADDSLGWPLKNLTVKSERQCYKFEVNKDIPISAGNILRSWNSLGHTTYWKDSDMINRLVEDMENLLK